MGMRGGGLDKATRQSGILHRRSSRFAERRRNRYEMASAGCSATGSATLDETQPDLIEGASPDCIEPRACEWSTALRHPVTRKGCRHRLGTNDVGRSRTACRGREYPEIRSALVDLSELTVPGRWLSCT